MKKVLLLGSGQSHVDLLSTLAATPLIDTQLTLIAPYPLHLYSGMVPGFVAGQHALEACLIGLEPLLKQSGVRWHTGSAVALDMESGTVRLGDGSAFEFDWLSIDAGVVQDRHHIESTLPGAREHGLFVRPLEAFCALWPKMVEMAANRPLRIAVLGGGVTAIELALAIRQRLAESSVTLVADQHTFGSGLPAGAQPWVLSALRRHQITLLSDTATTVEAQQVLLASGARLACDAPVIALGEQAPAWLGHSGLSLNPQGRIATDGFGRSTSHAHVFASSEITSRAQPALTANLLAALAGLPQTRPSSQPNTLHFLSYGDRRARVSWRGLSATGHWVWWLRNWLERRHLQRYSRD